MIRWTFNPDFLGHEAENLFGSLASTYSVEGELISVGPLSHVVRVAADGTRYYVKRYDGQRKSRRRRWYGLRALLAPQRVVREWKNLLRFRKWGIPTASLVCYGLERKLGSFVRGALVTAEIPDTLDLQAMCKHNDPRLRDRRWMAAVMAQVAGHTRTLHSRGFAHNDLMWRNLLVSGDPVPKVYLIDCPNGRFWLGPPLRYRIVKDLACLDKVAKHQLSRTQRLRFYLDYAQKRKLDAADKRRIGKVLAFFAGRE
jgi:tRNA A-37 threonylcarbamoyl transferase component Bud32